MFTFGKYLFEYLPYCLAKRVRYGVQFKREGTVLCIKTVDCDRLNLSGNQTIDDRECEFRIEIVGFDDVSGGHCKLRLDIWL